MQSKAEKSEAVQRGRHPMQCTCPVSL